LKSCNLISYNNEGVCTISGPASVLDRLDSAKTEKDMNIPGWDIHELKGKRKGVWSVSVRANWKITFRFENGDARDVNLEDYH